MPNGWGGMLAAMCVVAASFQGVELIGITAGEAQDPQKDAEKGCQQHCLAYPYILYWFYLCHPLYLSVDRSQLHWQSVRHDLAKAGVYGNGGHHQLLAFLLRLATGPQFGMCTVRAVCSIPWHRMVRHRGSLPNCRLPAFPATGSELPSLIVLAIGVVLNYMIPDSKLSLYLYSASVFPGMVAWFVLAWAQKNFRKTWGPEVMAKHPFKSPLYLHYQLSLPALPS